MSESSFRMGCINGRYLPERAGLEHTQFGYREDPTQFLKEYNQQRRIEAFFYKFKRRFGPVKSRIGTMQRKEV